MESRNITLTICGEWLDFSPRDRKAVCKIDDLFKLTRNISLVSYPLYNLIPEIISDENLERSFKRVMANLRNADARNGNRSMPKTIIDGIECSPRMIRYVTNKGKIFEILFSFANKVSKFTKFFIYLAYFGDIFLLIIFIN